MSFLKKINYLFSGLFILSFFHLYAMDGTTSLNEEQIRLLIDQRINILLNEKKEPKQQKILKYRDSIVMIIAEQFDFECLFSPKTSPSDITLTGFVFDSEKGIICAPSSFSFHNRYPKNFTVFAKKGEEILRFYINDCLFLGGDSTCNGCFFIQIPKLKDVLNNIDIDENYTPTKEETVYSLGYRSKQICLEKGMVTDPNCLVFFKPSILVNMTSSSSFVGSPLFNKKQDLIGFMILSDTIHATFLPIFYARKSYLLLQENKMYQSISMGIPLKFFSGNHLAHHFDCGDILQNYSGKNATYLAISSETRNEATLNGLQNADVILKANKIDINKQNIRNFFNILEQEEKIELDILRFDEVIKIDFSPIKTKQEYTKCLSVFGAQIFGASSMLSIQYGIQASEPLYCKRGEKSTDSCTIYRILKICNQNVHTFDDIAHFFYNFMKEQESKQEIGIALTVLNVKSITSKTKEKFFLKSNKNFSSENACISFFDEEKHKWTRESLNNYIKSLGGKNDK